MSVFANVVGQELAVTELSRAVKAAHVQLQTNVDNVTNASAMSHAWLFTGPEGAGKSTLARDFAAGLLCEEAIVGCGNCAICKSVLANNNVDVEILRTDLVTISIDQVRDMVTKSYMAPASGKWRIFIIEDAERMTANTSNVLLKALEEPAERTVWVLCTAWVSDVLPTISSRCRQLNLITPNAPDVANLLVAECGVEYEQALIAVVAAQSNIAMARALLADEAAQNLRIKTLDALVVMDGVGAAVLTAKYLFDLAQTGGDVATQGKTKAKIISESVKLEQARLKENLGLADGTRIPNALRKQFSGVEDQVKRQYVRAQQDSLQQELIYFNGFFRDVLLVQLGIKSPLLNQDFSQKITMIAQSSTPQRTLVKIDAIMRAYERLGTNMDNLLLLESLLLEIVDN